jgi:hypothetical protein
MEKSPKEKYYVYEIAELMGKDERHVLDLANKGLTFSIFVTHADLELHQCEKHIEDVINGHEIFDTEVVKQDFGVFRFTVLDLYASTPLKLARGEVKVNPDFHIKDWHRVVIHSSEPTHALKDNIFVTAENMDAYSKLDKEFGLAYKKIRRQKVGRKPNKLEAIIKSMEADIEAGKETIETLRRMTQESLSDQYKVSRLTATQARDAVFKKLNC